MRLPLILNLMWFGIAGATAQTLQLTELCNMPSEILETSGLEKGPDDCFWTHNDSDNPAILYCVDTTGAIQRTVNVVGDENIDWEELAKDDNGNLFIGNFGNNSLNRTDLRIVKIPSIDTCTGTTFVTDTIQFSFPDQYDFPPIGDYGNFDMEAMVWYQDSLHLFSKDRSSPPTGYCKHYKLPALSGIQSPELVDSLYTGGSSFIFSVTSADLSDDNSQLVLLNSDRIWICSNFSGSDFFEGDVSELVLGNFTQKEGVCFRNGFIYITDEDAFGFGGNMYSLHPDIFVSIAEVGSNLEIHPVYNQNYVLESIKIPNQKVAWQLLNLDGKLLQVGSATSSILASEFQNLEGVFVLKMSSGQGQKAMLIKL